MQRERISYNAVGFHAQQAAEKFLEALLTRHGIPFPKTHRIDELLVLLEPVTPGIKADLQESAALSPFGAEIRYPYAHSDLNREEGAEAIRLATKVRAEVLSRLNDFLKRGRPKP